MRIAGFVSRHRQVYCSDQVHRWTKQRAAANRDLLSTRIAVSDHGDEIPLDELHDASLANPRNRFIEAMVRVRGLEEWAEAEGWSAVMATLTCPSRMHARRAKSGTENPTFDGTTPRQANDYLGRVWARVRAKLDRDGIPWVGFRSAEPHHDGCPHWHVLIWVPGAYLNQVQRIVRYHAMADSPNEPGARKRRVNFVRIDRTKGSAASYLAKYIAKSLDGGRNGQDAFGNPSDLAAERITAWARTWQIRQFAFYKQPSVTAYREYRRLRQRPPEPHGETWEACDRYRWREFIDYQAGATRARVVRCKHEVLDPYGDPVPIGCRPIVGLEACYNFLPTRIKRWQLLERPTSEKVWPTACTAASVDTRSEKASTGMQSDPCPTSANDASPELRPPTTRDRLTTVYLHPDLPTWRMGGIEPYAAADTKAGRTRSGSPWREVLADTEGVGPWTCVNNCTTGFEPNTPHVLRWFARRSSRARAEGPPHRTSMSTMATSSGLSGFSGFADPESTA